jgi:hypothetical protein
MVMRHNHSLKTSRGQSRILEVVIAAVIIFIVFSVSMFFIQPSDVRVLQERADLDRLGYNVLHRLVESGTIQYFLEVPLNQTARELNLRTAVQKSLQSAIYFNLTIYNCTESSSGGLGITLNPLNLQLSNTSADSFNKSLEVSSTTMTYTSKKGNIYYLVLVLARGG